MKNDLKNEFRMDKSAFSVINLHDDHSSSDYWVKQSHEKRLLALEFIRQSWNNYDPDTSRLPRLFTLVKKARR